jgi:hypothetical protein
MEEDDGRILDRILYFVSFILFSCVGCKHTVLSFNIIPSSIIFILFFIVQARVSYTACKTINVDEDYIKIDV